MQPPVMSVVSMDRSVVALDLCRGMRSHRRVLTVCRMALVQVLFESHPGPAIPESDPELRAVLLDSLKTYEQDEAQRPAFEERPHIPVPETSSSPGTMPPPSRLFALHRRDAQQGLAIQVSPATVHCMLIAHGGKYHST